MRIPLIAAILVAGLAVPASAQRTETTEQRVNRLEQELRAVQRRVFPGGRTQFVQPEIQPQATTPVEPAPTSTALSNLTTRVDALESQLRTLTNQVEEQGFRTRQLEQQVQQLRADLAGRLDRLEAPRAPTPAPAAEPETQAPPPAAAEPPAETPQPDARQGDAAAGSAEQAYNEGFRLWSAHRYDAAAQALDAAATRYPNTRWTSWMRNLQGRALLDDNKPATAARVLLGNYQDNPHGERAADSLFYLGDALTRLNRKPEACRVYAELEQVYPSMRAELRRRLPQARTAAACTSTAGR